METTNNVQVNDNNTLPVNANGTQSTPKAEKPKKVKARLIGEKQSCKLETASGIELVQEFVYAQMTKSIGEAVKQTNEKFSVKLFGVKITVPALRSGNDQADRVISFLNGLTLAIFAGCKEKTDLLPKDGNEAQHAILKSLRDKGYRFSQPTKLEVAKAVKAWQDKKRAAVKIQTENVRRLNQQMLKETAKMNHVALEMKKENDQAIFGWKVTTTKELNQQLRIENGKK